MARRRGRDHEPGLQRYPQERHLGYFDAGDPAGDTSGYLSGAGDPILSLPETEQVVASTRRLLALMHLGRRGAYRVAESFHRDPDGWEWTTNLGVEEFLVGVWPAGLKQLRALPPAFRGRGQAKATQTFGHKFRSPFPPVGVAGILGVAIRRSLPEPAVVPALALDAGGCERVLRGLLALPPAEFEAEWLLYELGRTEEP